MLKQTSLSDQGVSSGLLRHAWAADIEMASLLEEPLLNNKDLTTPLKVGEQSKIPDSVFMDVTPPGKDGKAARDVTHTFIDPLSGTGRYGNSEGMLGNEENAQLRYAKFYANDYSHALAGETFGIDYRELTPTQVYEKANKLLAQWNGERKGYFMRQAICESRALNLTKSPVSLTQPINPHCYVMGVSASSQPTYDPTDYPTYSTSIGAALQATYTGIHMSVANLLAFADWAEGKYLKTVNIKGMDVYLLMTHPQEITRLLDPATTAWANYWVTAAALQIKDIDNVVPGLVGVVGGKVAVLRDPRCPTMILGGSSTGYTQTFGYMKMGRNDGRTALATANVSFNANYALCKSALAHYENEPMHYEEQIDEYGKFKNVGIFGSDGYQLPVYDLDTATSSSDRSEGSAVVFTQRV
jgi:hypothetical protein